MKDNAWGEEPFDLRLTVLRMIRELPGILLVTVVITILLGGGYYLRNVTFRHKIYVASTTCHLEYADPNWYQNTKYLNEYTWGIWVQTSVFLEDVRKRLPDGMVSDEDLEQNLKAELQSDLRMVKISYSSDDKKKADQVIEAVGTTMAEEFASIHSDIASICVVDVKKGAENLKTVKPVRAAVLAAVIGLFTGVILFLLRELIFERIWLPSTLTERYGIPNAGIPETDAFRVNLAYFFEGKKRVAVCPAGADMDPQAFLTAHKEDGVLKEAEWIAMPYPVMAPESADALRNMDGVLLLVQAGEDVKHLKLMLDFLKGQDVTITAATLWDEDKWLLRQYYRWNPRV